MPHLALAIPIFRVTDLAASVRYYTRALGFSDEGVYRHDPSGSDGYAFLSRDGIRLHLSTYRGDGPLGAIAR
jgi:catechol 2,3-dioxygenase-like lactoylglutathione lyase family enzyme